MTGLLIFGAIILLLVVALEPAQRRLPKWAPRPGADSSLDRDIQRLQSELRGRTSSAQMAERTRRGPAGIRMHAPHVRRHSAA